MSELSQEFQAAQEIGKIYQSMTDKKALCDFFLESASQFVGAENAYLFLVGKEDRLWLEAKVETVGADQNLFLWLKKQQVMSFNRESLSKKR